MIRTNSLTKSAKGRFILQDVSIEIERGSIVSVLGPSGSGKTTLLRIIMGLEPYEKGELYFNDSLLSDGKNVYIPAEKRDFSLVFQEFTLFPHLNVYKNIVIGLDHKKHDERRAIADELLELLEITHLKNKKIDALSGGEQQRVAIARSIAIRPAVLLLDEPFSNVDRKMRERLFGRLKKILKTYNITVVHATHDHAEAFFFSDKIYVLRDGKVLDSNSPEALYIQPANSWVASFVGETNFLSGHELKTIFNMSSDLIHNNSLYLVRPEEFEISKDIKEAAKFVIEEIEFHGFYRTIIVSMENGKRIKIKDLNRENLTVGERVNIRIVKTNESILQTETDTPEGI